jgi:type IV secretory pathway VirB10-like protein
VRAVVTQDIRSFDGSQVVVPRSSRLIGQYKSGLAAGQTRAYVMWSRLIPTGSAWRWALRRWNFRAARACRAR